MLKFGQDAWSDEKIEATVNAHFIYTFIGEVAQQPVPEPAISPGTYAQVIVAKAKRLFLTLIDVGLPQEIVRLIDEFYDDTYLPFADDEVASLRLSNSNARLDELFYRQQFKYHIRVLREGEHIRYAPVEHAPFQILEQKVVNGLHDAPEKVSLPPPVNQVFVRRQLNLDADQNENDFLHEIAAAKPLSHEHILSIYGSYTQNELMFILVSPSTKYTLKNFLNDLPKPFEALAKLERRKNFLMWPHCLANALAWLHSQGAHHGGVRPSRIWIDDQFHVSLGEFEGTWLLASSTPKGDMESYQYAAPEFWKRGLTVQTHTSSRSPYGSSGRSAGSRLVSPPQHDESRRPSNDGSEGTTKTTRPSEERKYAFVPASRGNPSRLQLKATNRMSADVSTYLRSAESRLKNRSEDTSNSRPKRTLSRRLDALSLQTSNSSDTDRSSEAPKSKLIHSVPLETKQTMVQAWKSSARDLTAADIFALGCVAMDIFSVMCGRTVSAFAKYRSAKNRQAGRGGGLADASFHANLSQVMAWAEDLLKESEKKVKKESGQIFSAMEPILQTTLQCFDREPTKRPKAKTVALQLRKHLSSLSNINHTHCSLRLPEEPKERDTKAKSNTGSRVQTLQLNRIPIELGYPSQFTSKRDSVDPTILLRDHLSERTYSERTTMVTAPTSPAEVSFISRNAPFDERTRNPPPSIEQEIDEMSEDLYHYYEDQWKVEPHPLRQDPRRPIDARVWRDYTRDVDEDGQGDSQRSGRGVAMPADYRKYSYGPNIVNTALAASGDFEEMHSHLVLEYDYRSAAPNRELPPPPPPQQLPMAVPNSKKTRSGHGLAPATAVAAAAAARRPWTPYGPGVAKATSVLAQTVQSLER